MHFSPFHEEQKALGKHAFRSQLFLKVWGNLQELAVDLTGQGWIWDYK